MSNDGYSININDVTYTIELKEQPSFTIELNEQGPQGARGPIGPQGPQGEQGEKGEQGDVGPANTLTVGSVTKGEEAEVTIEGESPNQTINFVLPKGDKGDKGDRGEIGPIGPQGIQGEVGPQGPRGLKGDTGATGAQGPKGDTGDRGPQGLIGPQGERGLTGEQGPQGIQGIQGPVGPTGPEGPQGIEGPQGPQGLRGISVTGVEQISKVGLVATYRMYFSDGTNFEYEVTDGSVEGITRAEIIDKLGFEPASYTSVEEINDLIPNEATTNNKLADKAWVDGEIASVDSRVDMVVEDLGDVTIQVNTNTQRIEDLTTAKFPNVVIIGTPHIEGGQVSGYSNTNYLQFPFVDISRGLPFDIYFSFTTGSDVVTQQNVLDSYFGIALAIQNSKGIMALSSNGQTWDIGMATGTNTILPNTTYYVKYSWTGTQYNASLSTNDTTYVPDMVLNSTLTTHKTTIFIGGSPDLFGVGTAHPFKGTINFNKSRVDVQGITVWEGMADVGLASRANVSLNNLDEVGEARFTDLQDAINTKQPIGDYATNTRVNEVEGKIPTNNNQLTNGAGYITSSYHDSTKQDALVSGTNIKTLNNESILGSGNIEVKSAPDLDNITINKNSNDELQAIALIDEGDNQAYKERFVTQQEYNDMLEAGTLDANTYYNTEGFGSSGGGGGGASRPLFEHTILDYVTNDKSYGMADFNEWYSKIDYPKAYNTLVELYSNAQSSVDLGQLTLFGNIVPVDGVIGHFTNAQGVRINEKLPLNTANTWEMVAKIKYVYSSSIQCLFTERSTNEFGHLELRPDNTIAMIIPNATHSTQYVQTGSTQFVEGNNYYIKLSYNGSRYATEVSTTGKFNGEQSLICSLNRSDKLADFYWNIGNCELPQYSLWQPLQSELDLKDTYIKIDDDYYLLTTLSKIADNGLKIATTEKDNAIQSVYNTSSKCWLFELDLENERFRLPRSKVLLDDMNEKTGTTNHLYFYLGGR